MNPTLFHLAFPITDVAQAKAFYVDGLDCTVGRETHHALILNLCGHQLVAHITKEPIQRQQGIYPRHFGIVFTSQTDWEDLLERASARQLLFREAAKHRFLGLPTEHRTFFLEDPFHNLIEFKHYRDAEAIFGYRNYGAIGDVKETLSNSNT